MRPLLLCAGLIASWGTPAIAQPETPLEKERREVESRIVNATQVKSAEIDELRKLLEEQRQLLDELVGRPRRLSPSDTLATVLARVGSGPRVYVSIGSRNRVAVGWRLLVRDKRTRRTLGWIRVEEVKRHFSLCRITREVDPYDPIESGAAIETPLLDRDARVRLPIFVAPRVGGRLANPACRRATGLTFTTKREEAKLIVAPRASKAKSDAPPTVTPATLADYIDLPDYGPSTPIAAPLVRGRILTRERNRFRISLGRKDGVERGLRLRVIADGDPIAIVRVVDCSFDPASSLVEVVRDLSLSPPEPGDTVTTRPARPR